jgi:phosphinothricin acetyltransferase
MTTSYGATTVRRAQVGDGDAVRTIRNAAISGTTAIWTDVQQSPEQAASWLAEHLDRGSIFVAECGGEVIGFSCWGPWREKEGYRFTVEDSVYLAEAGRGLGLGQALLEPLVGSAKESGAHAMVANIEARNVASIRLHQRLGFETIGTLREVGTKFGRWLDLTIMQLSL